MIHGASLEPLYAAGACSEGEKTRMLNSMYLAVMGFITVSTGNTSHLRPTSTVEVFEPGTITAVARATDASDSKFDSEYEGKNEAYLDGFGFPFARDGLDQRIHNARVACIDFSCWKLKHYLHFLSKLDNSYNIHKKNSFFEL